VNSTVQLIASSLSHYFREAVPFLTQPPVADDGVCLIFQQPQRAALRGLGG
jgi:hypothetical protein